MRALPNLGLIGFFDLGEDGWDDEMSDNLRRLSVLVQPVVDSILPDLPGAPTDGDVVLLDATNATNPNEIAVRDAGAWVYIEPREGWKVYDATTNADYRFDGAAWVAVTEGGGGGVDLRPIAFFFTSAPTASETMLLYTATENITFPIDFAGSAGSVGANPTAAMTFTVAVNGAAAGTIGISTGGAVSFTAAAAVNLVAGDRLSVSAPAGVDATIANVSITLRGTAS